MDNTFTNVDDDKILANNANVEIFLDDEGKEYVVSTKNEIFYLDDYRLLANGAIQNRSTAKIAAIANGGYLIDNTEKSRAATRKKWTKGRQLVDEAMAGYLPSVNSEQMYKMIVQKVISIVLDDDAENKDKITAAKFIGYMSGYTPSNVDLQQVKDDNRSNASQIRLDKDALDYLIQQMSRYNQDNVDNQDASGT